MTTNCIRLMQAILLFLFVSTMARADDPDISTWKDPINRDETIAYTTVSSVVSRQEDGLYRYTYTVDSSTDNKGTISNLSIDLSCGLDFGDVMLPSVPFPDANFDASDDGQHVPAALFGVAQQVNAQGISSTNEGQWTLLLPPGKQRTGFYLVSPAPPGLRNYTMIPVMHKWGWRYDLYEPGDPRIKWIPDFTVTGQVIGPACKIKETPEIAFLGSAEEPFGLNKLLAYAKPISDELKVQNGEVTLTIFYDEDLGSESGVTLATLALDSDPKSCCMYAG